MWPFRIIGQSKSKHTQNSFFYHQLSVLCPRLFPLQCIFQLFRVQITQTKHWQGWSFLFCRSINHELKQWLSPFCLPCFYLTFLFALVLQWGPHAVWACTCDCGVCLYIGVSWAACECSVRVYYVSCIVSVWQVDLSVTVCRSVNVHLHTRVNRIGKSQLVWPYFCACWV